MLILSFSNNLYSDVKSIAMSHVRLLNIRLVKFKNHVLQLIPKLNIKNKFEFNTDPKIANKILSQFLSINLAFFSILLAFYIAIVAYFIPQIHQYKLNRELEFNNMLGDIDKMVPGKASSKDYVELYENDTVLIDKILYDIVKSELINAGHNYEIKEKLSMQYLTGEAVKYINTLIPINLICNEPVMGVVLQENSSYSRRKHIPFDKSLYSKIDNFIRSFCYSKILTNELGPKLILYTLEDTVIYDTQGKLTFYSDIYEVKKDRMVFAKIYENFENILNTYSVGIANLNFKIESYEALVTAIKNKTLIYSILAIFLLNILFPLFIPIFKVPLKFVIPYLLIGLIPYIFIIIQITTYIKTVIY